MSSLSSVFKSTSDSIVGTDCHFCPFTVWLKQMRCSDDTPSACLLLPLCIFAPKRSLSSLQHPHCGFDLASSTCTWGTERKPSFWKERLNRPRAERGGRERWMERESEDVKYQHHWCLEASARRMFRTSKSWSEIKKKWTNSAYVSVNICRLSNTGLSFSYQKYLSYIL